MDGQESEKTETGIIAEQAEETANAGGAEKACGRVWLVGAGPGAPDLITKRGYELLKKADVVVYDALILPETLEMIPDGVEKIYVGKRAGAHSVPQEEIEQILIREAQLGKRVVRLKGGDPFVFGRGGEEALALAAQGIPCDVVPGITSAVAVPEAFGIPVTHRGLSASFTVITGHGQAGGDPACRSRMKVAKIGQTGDASFTSDRGKAADESACAVSPQKNEHAAYAIDYQALVRTGGTLIFLMGLSAAGEICRGLMEGGMRPDMPAAALSKGTTPAERMVRSTVSRLPEDILISGLEAPAILVVGEVCAFPSQWRRDEFASEKDIRCCGKMQELKYDSVGVSEAKHATVVVTRQEEKSEEFCERIRQMGIDVRKLPAIRIRRPDAETLKATTSALRWLSGQKGEEIQDFERSEGMRTAGSGEEMRIAGKISAKDKTDWIIFTSANGVHAFFSILIDAGIDLRDFLVDGKKKFAVVGPKTAEALKEHGILADFIPKKHTGAALAEELWSNFGSEKTAGLRTWFFGARKSDESLGRTLAAHGIWFRSFPVYETVSAVRPEDAKKLAEEISTGGQRFFFTFTSTSCVTNLAAAMEESGMLRGQMAVCIGEKTAAAAAKAGMRTVTARESTEEGMLEILREMSGFLNSE